MAHITANSHGFSMPKPHLGETARTAIFYVTVALIAIAIALPAAVMTAGAPL
ncbi:MAG: hypothetical protein ACE5FO_01415 [Parvularculaceae bacterium]